MYFYTLISGKIIKKFWHVQFLHKSSNTGWWWNLLSLKWVLFLMYFIHWFREKYSKNSGTYSFYTKWRIYVWKGLSLVILLISNTGWWWRLFLFKVSFVSYVPVYADFGENIQKILARTVLKKTENTFKYGKG